MLAVCAHLPMQSHPRALLSDTGRALFIGDLRFAAKLCLFLRIKSRSRTDGASLDGAEGAARRKEPEKVGVGGRVSPLAKLHQICHRHICGAAQILRSNI